jgi:hypothetical protein
LWGELIAYFHFTVILISDKTSKKKTLVFMGNKVKKKKNTILEAALLVLLMGVTYKVHR